MAELACWIRRGRRLGSETPSAARAKPSVTIWIALAEATSPRSMPADAVGYDEHPAARTGFLRRSGNVAADGVLVVRAYSAGVACLSKDHIQHWDSPPCPVWPLSFRVVACSCRRRKSAPPVRHGGAEFYPIDVNDTAGQFAGGIMPRLWMQAAPPCPWPWTTSGSRTAP